MKEAHWPLPQVSIPTPALRLILKLDLAAGVKPTFPFGEHVEDCVCPGQKQRGLGPNRTGDADIGDRSLRAHIRLHKIAPEPIDRVSRIRILISQYTGQLCLSKESLTRDKCKQRCFAVGYIVNKLIE